MKQTNYENLALTWSEKKCLDGKSFDELFTIEGIPLGWFYKKMFLPNVIPKKINLTNLIISHNKIQPLKIIKAKIYSKALSKYLLWNEKKKIGNRLSSESKDGEKILFATFTNHISQEGEIFRLQNLIDQVREDGIYEPFVLTADPLSYKSSMAGAKKNTFYSYYDPEINKKVQNDAELIHNKWKNISKEDKKKLFEMQDEMQGISAWSYTKFAADFYFSKEFLQVLLTYFEISKRIIEKENVKIIVLSSPNSIFEKCLIAAGYKAGLQSVVLQHGMGLYKTISNVIPIHYAVFGDQHKETIVNNGADSSLVHVTGPVIFDDAFKCSKKVGPPKDPDDKTSIFMVTSPYVEDNNCEKKSYFKRMRKILIKINNSSRYNINLKLHPREKTLSEYKKIVVDDKLDHITFSDLGKSRKEFYRLIKESDCVINFGSTSALEAIIIDKPIVTIGMAGQNLLRGFIKESTICINHDEDVLNAITKSIQAHQFDLELKQKREDVLNRLCGVVDGNAGPRVVELLYKIINSQLLKTE